MSKLPNNAYLPCMKCDAWVPGYAEEIHTVECHHLRMSQFSHPYIRGSSMYAEPLLISDPEALDGSKSKEDEASKRKKQDLKKQDDSARGTKKKDKRGHNHTEKKLVTETIKSKFEEPEWLKKIFPSFHYQIVLLNERDLIRCNISAYSPVELEYDGHSCAFLAVPDENVQIGCIVLHRLGCEVYFPSLKSTSLVLVKRIASVEVAKEVILSSCKTQSKKGQHLIEEQIKHQLYSTCPLGSEFTLKIGSKVHLHTLKRSDQVYQVSNYVLPDNEISDPNSISEVLADRLQDISLNSCSSNDSVFDKSSTVPSQLLTLDEYKCSDSSALASDLSKLRLSSDDTGAAFVTIDEYHEGSSSEESKDLDAGIVTSTPNKKSNTTLHKSLLAARMREKIITSGESEEGIKQWKIVDPSLQKHWIRIGRETKITIQNIDEVNTKTHNEQEKDYNENVYYKSHAYEMLLKIMENKFRDMETMGNPLLGGWTGVLLHGPPGTGKTLMVKQAADEMNVPVISLTSADVTKSSASGSEEVYQKFRSACDSSPSVLFMDEVDSLCPAGNQKSVSGNDVLAAVIRGIHIVQDSSKPVLLIGATSRPDAVAPKLQSPGRLDRQLLVPLPDAHQRAFILQKLLSSQSHRLQQKEIFDIAKQAYGFSGADLDVLIKSSWLHTTERIGKNTDIREQVAELSLCQEDLSEGLKTVVPTMMRQNYTAISVVKWDDIWGYPALKSKLQKMIHQHQDSPDEHPLKGLLLYGPPGCSKTMFVRALVNETNFSFFPLKCSNLLSKYVGETEKSLSKVFVRAQQAAPSIIFMDEIDSLCGDRSGGSLLVSELLSLMSGTKYKGNIWIIGATNRPAAVDEALLQPGCLEQIVHVDLPDFTSRCDIWKGILTGVSVKEEINVANLSDASAGHSGAEITGIYQEAAYAALADMERIEKERQSENLLREDSVVPCVTEDVILKTIRSMPPRTPSSLLQTISLFTDQRKSLCKTL